MVRVKTQPPMLQNKWTVVKSTNPQDPWIEIPENSSYIGREVLDHFTKLFVLLL